jgi:hypothetical protein
VSVLQSLGSYVLRGDVRRGQVHAAPSGPDLDAGDDFQPPIGVLQAEHPASWVVLQIQGRAFE